MEEKGRRVKFIYPVLSSLFIFLGFFLFKFFSITVEKILTLPLSFPNLFFKLRLERNLLNVIIYFLKIFARHLIPFLPIVAGIAIMIVYGMKEGENKKLSLIGFIIPSILGLIYLGLSPVTLLFSIGIISVGTFISGMGETLPEELKKWKSYRTGTNSMGKSLFIINILLTAGIFFTLLGNINHYETVYKTESNKIVSNLVSGKGKNLTEETLISILPEETRKTFEKLPEDKKEDFIKNYKKKVESETKNLKSNIQGKLNKFMGSEKISALIDLSLLFIILAIFGILEFLKTAIFCPLAGLITCISNKS